MSEIDIERKESGGVPWWAWLLGALVLAALIWYATAAMSAKPGTEPVAVGVDNTAMAVVPDGAMDANVVGTDAMDANMADNSAMATNMDSNAAMTNSAMVDGAMTNSAMVDASMSNSAPDNSTVPAAKVAAITNILSVVDAKEPKELYGKTVKLLGAPVQAAGKTVFWIGPSFAQKMLVVTDASTNMNGINTGVAQRDRVNIEGTLMEITDFDDAKTKYNLDGDAITFLTNKKMLLMATSVTRDKN